MIEVRFGAQGMFCKSFPGLNRIVRPGGIRTSFPVRGLRPMPRFRGFTWKTPNPRSSMRSPRCIEFFIASSTASTACSAFTLVMFAVADTSLMMSTFIILTSGGIRCDYRSRPFECQGTFPLSCSKRSGYWRTSGADSDGASNHGKLGTYGETLAPGGHRRAAQRRQVHALQPDERRPKGDRGRCRRLHTRTQRHLGGMGGENVR